jgi:5-formyltetrahydrofolate cyclo-ligase
MDPDLDLDLDPALDVELRYRAKTFLRQRSRALRNTFPRGAIAARSSRIVAALEALPLILEARAVALFYPIEGRNEVDLTALDPWLRARGARVAYPALDPLALREFGEPADLEAPSERPVMRFRFVDEMEAMEERGYGFREPEPSAPEATALDVIVVPALQIDDRGHRLGYGAGYYDRTLPRYAPPARSIGVAFSFQLIPEVPVTEGDVPVSLVVTDDRVLEPIR